MNQYEFTGDNIFASFHPPNVETSIFESDSAASAEEFGGMQLRSQAMAVVLAWVDEGDFTLDALDAYAQGMADLDGDGELSEDEAAELDSMMTVMADAFTALGADEDNVNAFLGDGDDAAGAKLGAFLSGRLDEESADDESLINNFAVSQPVFETTKRVVRGGEIVFKKVRTRKVRLSAAQKAGLRKARRKANTGAAKRARAKAMHIRKKRRI